MGPSPDQDGLRLFSRNSRCWSRPARVQRASEAARVAKRPYPNVGVRGFRQPTCTGAVKMAKSVQSIDRRQDLWTAHCAFGGLACPAHDVSFAADRTVLLWGRNWLQGSVDPHLPARARARTVYDCK